MDIKVNGSWFKDEHGRTLHLRGVNLGGSTKVPTNGATWNREGFFDHRNVSFVGKPFPLGEADEHFSRLRKWGLTFLRFLITWEAVEHEGPGIYDEAYLDYLHAVIKKAADHDIHLFIDPHQDVWSRFSGGDGAPGWTFEAVGMDITRFKTTGAALTHQEHGDPYPPMIWPANAGKFACSTMFTLFFGGNDFAPETRVDGVPVQEYLQSHYINAMKQVALRLKDLPNVVGYDTLNEPFSGYIGVRDLDGFVIPLVNWGETPTVFQGMLLASGYPQELAVGQMPPNPLRRKRRSLINPNGVSLWMDGFQPIWKQNRVWDVNAQGEPQLLNPEHFCIVNGKKVNFDRDYFTPFVDHYIREIRAVHPGTMIFVSPQPANLGGRSCGEYSLDDDQQIVHAPHWYDGITLGLQRYIPWLGVDTHGGRAKFVFGHKRVRRSFAQQVRRLVDISKDEFGGVPTLIGETGVAMNMNGKEAYRTGDFSSQIAAMDDTMQALEANLVSFTLWNYTADNTNKHGDLWNDEDLSIFSRDQQTGSGEIHDGGRALDAVVRPYALKTPGEPLHMCFDIKTRIFEFEFRLDPHIDIPAELYIPDFQYPHGYQVIAPHGRCEKHEDTQTLLYYPGKDQAIHKIQVLSF
ncbi:MAG: cellulase family glycosylhydrolase [Anaerolineaceae bacterium]|nr:cellulase family glycosylhydrolase [Anaerolineaceae bacterium]